MKITKFFLVVIIFFCIVMFSFLNSIYHGIEENRTAYNFKITKLDTTQTRTLIFYDDDKKITLWNFIVPTWVGVKVGDYLIKDQCAKILFIKRKTTDGKFIEIIRCNNSSYFANLICD